MTFDNNSLPLISRKNRNIKLISSPKIKDLRKLLIQEEVGMRGPWQHSTMSATRSGVDAQQPQASSIKHDLDTPNFEVVSELGTGELEANNTSNNLEHNGTEATPKVDDVPGEPLQVKSVGHSDSETPSKTTYEGNTNNHLNRLMDWPWALS